MPDGQFQRLALMIGEDNVRLLQTKKVTIAGAGAVGGYAIEALARCGIGHMVIADFDSIELSNINRQIIALHSTLGRKKAEVAAERVKDINPECDVTPLDIFICEENHDMLLEGTDLLLDCIDSVGPKIDLLAAACQRGVPVVSSMGAALRKSISAITRADIMDTYGCPLARLVRSGLKKRGISGGIEAVFSPEKPAERSVPETDGRRQKILGSLPTVTAAFGLMMAEAALEHLLPEVLSSQTKRSDSAMASRD